jgi:hypothetical protein
MVGQALLPTQQEQDGLVTVCQPTVLSSICTFNMVDNLHVVFLNATDNERRGGGQCLQPSSPFWSSMTV